MEYRRLIANLTPQQHAWVQATAASLGVSMAAVIRDVIDEAMNGPAESG